MKRNSGFTLIELLVVISIIGLLSSVVLAALTSARARGKVGAGLTMANSMYSTNGLDAEAFFDFDDYYSAGSPTLDRTIKWTGLYFDYDNTVPTTNTPTGSGYAFTMDSANDYLIVRSRETNQAADFPIHETVTVAVWVKLNATGNRPVFSNRLGGGIYIGVNDGKFYVQQNDIAPARTTESNASVNDDKWHFLVWTANGNTSVLYIDGKQDKKEGKFFRENSGKANIGRNPANTTEYFLGSMDDLAIYNDKTLLASEVEEMYLAALPKYLARVK
jgi:prepilin-type N-terminal cleavage/methylation domain-containing protein